MAQTLTFITLFAAMGGVLWWLQSRLSTRDDVRISIRLDRAVPGTHLIWDIENTGAAPMTLSSFLIRPRRVGDGRGESLATVPLPEPETLGPGDRARLMMDVDWRLFGARTVAVCDAAGREHAAAARQLDTVQTQLHELVDRPASTASAPDWLRGAANLTFGVVILGLGFFMLMWVLATG